MPTQLPAAALAFLQQPITASMVTLNADGSPQMTYVWFDFDGEKFHISTTTPRLKYKNLVRNPQMALGILDPANPYRYVTVKGTAAISEAGAQDLILRLAIKYQGQEKGEPYGRSLMTPDRRIITLTPDNFYAYGF